MGGRTKIDTVGNHYFLQFVIQYGIILVGMGIFFITELFVLPRTARHFLINDPSISKPFKEHEIVPTTLCLVLSLGVPTVVCLAVCLAQRGHLSRDSNMPLPVSLSPAAMSSNAVFAFRAPANSGDSTVHVFHCSMVQLWLATALMAGTTNILKLLIGNLRPDFLARCKPQVPPGTPTSTLLTIKSCAMVNSIVYEGFKSTPSGHSSFICCGMAFLFQWLGTFLPTKRRWVHRAWCPVLAVLVMWSRVIDGRHHWYDVVFGCALGVTAHVIAARAMK
ncbi:HCL631Wp [Eremothecium sinecaudum]|uniref:HCL631Wp n=1 Tax=Eremothecium sinecaudum TaxID=45286 RepID=A0A109UXW3_9SACH|nr:HCL631Wp [Eremothecium sinecaudum]AMD19520.1 HCL631Wp [Eremothecium sinecaudum]